ncbi:MAG TPA: glycosyltransferase [Polyangiaceae bacterium]|nr:glycosyltransferase [Polyangiaceae bacterium]
MSHWFQVLALFLCTAWTLLGAAAVVLAARRPVRRGSTPLPPVSVLKPLAGADPDLARNLESFFVQDHPDYEILFGVEDPADPAIRVAASCMARHPEIRSRIVVHRAGRGTNPKVRNLRGIIGEADHDLVVVSDSNVRVPRHYLSELVSEYVAAGPRAGLVTNLIRGVDESGVGAALESTQLAGFCAAGVAGPTLLGDSLVVGKSMLFSRSLQDRLGGLESVQNVLAEDYVLGKMFQHAGYRVLIARTPVDNVTRGTTVRSFFERQRRWAMLRLKLRPFAYPLEPLTSPLFLLPFAWAALGPWALAWAAGLLLVRDVGQWLVLSGPRGAWMPLLLSPVREAIVLAVWAAAPFKRHVSWRGHRVRLSAGSVAYVAEPARATSR